MTPNSNPNRRRFIKTISFGTAFSSLLGKSWTDVLAGEIRPSSASTSGILRLKLSQFPALLDTSGSVRLAINPLNGNTGPIGQFYPVIVNRGPNHAYPVHCQTA